METARIMVRLPSTSLKILARIAAVGIAGLLLFTAPVRAAEQQPQMTGDTRIHDPSVIEVDGRFAAFGTGQQGPTHGAIRV
jgi:arabinan endo-1,5-alpha-L-arabinosidase